MSIEKILPVWKEYANIRKKLKESGISFTNRDPKADFSEIIVSKLLGAKLADSSTKKDYDLIKGNIKYQVKSLAKGVENKNGFIIKQKDRNNTSDYYVFVFYHPDFMLKKIYLVKSDFIKNFKRDHKEPQIRENDLKGNELKKEHCINRTLFSKLKETSNI